MLFKFFPRDGFIAIFFILLLGSTMGYAKIGAWARVGPT